MTRLLSIPCFLIFISSGQNPRNQETTQIQEIEINKKTDSLTASVDSSKLNQKQRTIKEDKREQIELTEPTVVIVKMDSLEIEELKKTDGEDNFYTAADDLMWYNSQLLEKMDSIGLPVKFTDQDHLKIKTPTNDFEISKDTTFSLYTYFYYDGENFKRTDLFELLDD